jgi:outer membrane protein assembly factor BamB
MRRAGVTAGAIAAVVVAVIAALLALPGAPAPKPNATAPPAAPPAAPAAPEIALAWQSPPLIERGWLVEQGMYQRAWSWWTFVKGIVQVSPDGRYVAVGTQRGEVVVFDRDGREVARFTYGAGRVPYYVLELSPDGKYLAVGIASRERELIVYDTSTWREAAHFNFSSYLKGPSNATEATILKQPWYGIRPTFLLFRGDVLYVAVGEPEIDPKTQSPVYFRVAMDLFRLYPELRRRFPNLTSYVAVRYAGTQWSRVFAMDTKTWRVKWVWPREEPAESAITNLASDAEGRYLALSTWWYMSRGDPYRWHSGMLFVLNATSGELLYVFDVPPYVPYFNYTAIWTAPAFTPDGRYIAFTTGDGRVYMLDNLRSIAERGPVVLWTASLSEALPAQVLIIPERGGEARVIQSYIYTFGGLAGIVNNRVIAYTSSTYTTYWAPGVERKPVVQHPNQTKLFVFDLNGTLLYVDKFLGKPAYGKVVPFAMSGCLLAVGVEHDWVTGDASMMGVYVWDVCRLAQVGRFLTARHGVPLDVAMSGSRIYVLTGPINVAPSERAPAKIIGEYQLLALELRRPAG